MKYIDIVVDGKYIEEERDITLAFRGSKNQKIVEVNKWQNLFVLVYVLV